MRTKYIGWRLRMNTILRDRACRHCGKPVAYTTGASVRGNACWRAYDAEGSSFHFDHIKPVSKGGKATADNIQLLCAKCNYQRETQPDFPARLLCKRQRGQRGYMTRQPDLRKAKDISEKDQEKEKL